MTFKITIEETKEEVTTQGREWVKTGEREVLSETSMFDAANADEPRTRIESIYGYNPEIQKKSTATKTIYEQRVDSLTLSDVILSINGINQIEAQSIKDESNKMYSQHLALSAIIGDIQDGFLDNAQTLIALQTLLESMRVK